MTGGKPAIARGAATKQSRAASQPQFLDLCDPLGARLSPPPRTGNLSPHVARRVRGRYDPPSRQRCPGRSVAQPGSASAWGAEGREFESLRSDHFFRHLRERPDGPAAASNPVAITRQVKFPPWRRPICDLRPHPFAGGFRRVDVADPLFYLPAGG